MQQKMEKPEMPYVLGLCLSTTSVGWSVLETDETGIPFRIADLGVRTFQEAKTNYKRSKCRTSRRRLQRKSCIKSRVSELFERSGLITKEALEEIFVKSGFEKDIIVLRKDGLDRKLENDEWARVLYNFTQRRGYKVVSAAREISAKKIAEESKKRNSKSNLSNEDKVAQEEAKRHAGLLAAVNNNTKELKKDNYRTIGEMFCSSKDERFMVKDGSNREIGRTTRNKHGIYSFAVSRELIKDEISKLFDAQRKQGNKFADKSFQKEYENIVFSHNDKPQDLRGNCFFEKGEKCAFKGGYTFEYFKLLCELNNIRIISTESKVDEAVRKITESQRNTIIGLYKKSPKLTPKDLSKKLNLKSSEYLRSFNTKQMQTYHEIREALNKVTKNIANDLSNEQFDEIGEILSRYKNDDERREKLQELRINVGLGNSGLGDAEIKSLLELNFSGTGSLSLTAMKNLIPYLEKGLSYGEACEKVYGDHRTKCGGERMEYLSFKKLKEEGALDSINSPVVARATTQAFKVINAVIRKYGCSPQSVHIELSRDIKCNSKTRERIAQENEANGKRRKKLIDEIEKIKKQKHCEKVNATEQEILKLQLYKDQNGKCLYSGKELDKDKVISESGYAEIDHIIPYSQSFDNSEANKVLTLSEENRNKGNDVPVAYILRKHKNSEKEYEAFVKRVKSVTKEVSNANKDRQKILEKRKQNLLISPNFKVDELEGLLVRETVGVQNIQKRIADILRNYLRFYDEMQIKQHVVVTKNSITEAICEQLGLQRYYTKVSALSSALNAILIAVTPANYEAKVTQYVQSREEHYTDDGYIDPENGKKLTIEEFDAKYMPESDLKCIYSYLKEEIEIWMSSASDKKGIGNQRNKLRKLYKKNFEGKYAEEIDNWKPIFVSRMPNRKVSGQAHAETIRSARVDIGKSGKERIIAVAKTPLTSLKLDKDDEIENYYMPSSDRLLYEELKKRLKACHGSAEQAFKEPVYKPKKDGSKGPRVYKVKTCMYESRGKYVEINDCNTQSRKKAIAKKGDIVRVDIFHITDGKDQGYYFVPIYVADTIKNTLPKHAVVTNSKSSKVEWKEMDDSNFIFSLYKGDLIYIERCTDCKDKNSDNKMRKAKGMYVYYNGVDFYQSDRCTNQSIGELNGAINASWHDGSCEDSIYSKEISVLEKYEVDVLGNYHKVRLPEKRQTFNLKYSQKEQ